MYKLKTGCQWSLFPVEALFSVKVLTYGTVTIITGNGARAANGNPYGFGYLTTTVLNWTCPAQRIEKDITNIRANKRRDNADDILVDDELYAERYYIERTDAWVDSFRTVLNRFDTTVSSRTSWNYLAFAILLLKKISRK